MERSAAERSEAECSEAKRSELKRSGAKRSECLRVWVGDGVDVRVEVGPSGAKRSLGYCRGMGGVVGAGL